MLIVDEISQHEDLMVHLKSSGQNERLLITDEFDIPLESFVTSSLHC